MFIFILCLLFSPITAQEHVSVTSMESKMASIHDKLQQIDPSIDFTPFLRSMTHHLGHMSETPIHHTTEGKHLVNVCLNLSHTADSEHRKRTDEFISPFVHKDPDSFAFVIIASEPQWANLLDSIASIHATAFTHPILVFARNMPPDAISHLAMISFVEVIPLSQSDYLDEFDLFRDSFLKALRKYSLLFYLPADRILVTNNLCFLDHNSFPFIAQSNPSTHISTPEVLNNLLANENFNQMTIPNAPGRHEELYGNVLSCILTLRVTLPPPGPHALANTGKPRVCLCIASYNSHSASPTAFSLNNIVLASLARVLSPDTYQKADVYVYIGTQPEANWDDPNWRDATLAEADRITNGKIGFRLFRYPFYGKFRDITAKYNMLILQAYADGCDYMYQYSDDTEFNDESRDWPIQMLKDYADRKDFGTWGMRDLQNMVTMTLGASSRTHIDLNGWFWPPLLKNWYSDDFIQRVYGPEFSICREDLKIRNKQTYGQRYDHCLHMMEYELSEIVAQARAMMGTSSLSRKSRLLFTIDHEH